MLYVNMLFACLLSAHNISLSRYEQVCYLIKTMKILQMVLILKFEYQFHETGLDLPRLPPPPHLSLIL